MKKVIVLLVAFVATLTLAACSNTGEVEASGSTLLAIDINPSVEFILDEEGNVLSVTASNEDAEVVLSNLDLVGLPYEDAVEAFIDEVVELGYIDVTTTDNTIIFTVGSEDEEQENSISVEAQEVAQGYLEEHKIGGAVLNGELVYEELAALSEQYGISIGKVRIIQSAITKDETLTFEELAEMEMNELMNLVTTRHKEEMKEFIANKKAAAQEKRETAYNNARAKVEEHRKNVDDDSTETPDYTAIRDQILEEKGVDPEEYQSKAEEARNKAKGNSRNNNE